VSGGGVSGEVEMVWKWSWPNRNIFPKLVSSTQ
jgi:hypothetical protein